MENNLAALDAVKGDFSTARRRLEAALAIDETCRPARLNLELLTNRLEAIPGREGEAEANATRTEPRPPTNTESQASTALGTGLITAPSTGPAGAGGGGPCHRPPPARPAPGRGFHDPALHQPGQRAWPRDS